MIREYPNGDKAEIKGLTVTVELGEESIGRIRKAALDEIDSLKAENAKLRELVSSMYRNMQGVLDCSTDTVFANSIMTLRDYMDECMEVMAELGMPPRDYESRRRELGLED